MLVPVPILVVTALLSATSQLFAQGADAPIYNEDAIFHPVVAYGGMVVSQEQLASESAAQVLSHGGNAIDAAVTAAFSLAVTLPRAGNIGGGGFMVVHLADGGENYAIDFREMAPAASEAKDFINADGSPDPAKTRSAATASGVPGTVRGLALALEKSGSLKWADTLKPAIKLAEEGFRVTEDLHDSLKVYQKAFADSTAAINVFFKEGSVPAVNSILKQSDLASTLKRLAEHGPAEFYTGETAKKIAGYMASEGGIMTADDLANYHAIVRKPLEGNYRGVKILTMPPPSVGGATLLQILGIMENFPLEETGANSAATLHLMCEAMKMAHANRSKGFGDPDFVKIPLDQLLAPETLQAQAKQIDLSRARPSTEIRPFLEAKSRAESHETTHLSIIDQWGNAVSLTYTLNFSYGSKRMVPGTGILLNNEMDDFNVVPGIPNAYGLPNDEANGLAPGKRMLSSMTPVIAFFPDGELVVTGSPGGSRIPTSVLQVLMNRIDHGMNIAEASNTPRIHHQWQPDILFYERGISSDTLAILKSLGHPLQSQPAMGSTQTARKKGGTFTGAADPRRRGSAAVGVELPEGK